MRAANGERRGAHTNFIEVTKAVCEGERCATVMGYDRLGLTGEMGC
jgi:hypothetical protein